ncbi:hypothetical protein ASE06_16000 [Sphingopyxis sp. Root214]|uniref:hypothetical protein n=1 Tax=unclassified Sphingopyxis TaxID=2614943 RepID=UPI00071530FA|nr:MULTISPECIES: hypothetical protein [unclassified Sphingopyxis]KRC07973.1 hypothetical protein ASE06_16000 [Sphingopyxis sp. Root214]
MEKATDLAQLAAMLRAPGLPPQVVLAAEARVDQSLVSRARGGKLKRATQRVARLERVVRSRFEQLALAERLASEEGKGCIKPPGHAEVLEQVSSYLADGLDGSLLVQQLAVLRRAQRSRAGRPPLP